MPRAFFPHSLHDVLHAVDGPLGLVVGDMPDGRIWVLKRNRKTSGYRLSHYDSAARTRILADEEIEGRREAVNRFCAAIALGEALP